MRLVVPALLLSLVYALKLGDDSEAFSEAQQKFVFNCASPLLIYAEAKSGTSTLAFSFGKYCGMDIPLRRRLPEKTDWPRAIKCNGFQEVCSGFLDRFAEEPVTVISTVRNPFERLVSLHFQTTVKSYFDAGRNVSLENVERAFTGRIDRLSYEQDSFYDELQKNLNLNYSSIKTNRRGHFKHWWHTRNGGRVYNIVLLRLEDVDSWEATIQKRIPDWKLWPLNLADDKVYLSLYERFAKHFMWTFKEVDMVQHKWGNVLDTFYTDKEKQDMLSSLNVSDDITARASREKNHKLLLGEVARSTRQSFGDLLEP